MIVVPSPTKQLGTIKQNEPVTIRYEVQNTGDEFVDVLNMGTQCGCTAASMSIQPIPPNSTAIFSCVYNAAHHGNVNKSAWFSTKYGQQEVYFSVNVQ